MIEAAPDAAHAEYGASSMDRWTSCLGSSRLCTGLPGYDTEWSEDGKAAHKLIEICLKSGVSDASGFLNHALEFEPGKSTVIDAEHVRNVNVLLAYVSDVVSRYPDAQVSVEHRVHIPSNAVPGRMWGTCDVKIYVPSIAWLFIIDYKHGVGISVTVHDNKQLRFYGLGALWEHMLAGDAVAGVTLAIVQPRSLSTQGGGVKDIDITTAELFAFHNYAEDRAYATLDAHAPLVPHPDYCRWCPAAGHGRCPVIERTALAVVGGQLKSVSEINKETLPDPKNLSFDQMSAILDARPLLIALMKQVYETAIGFARQGGYFPGRKLVFTGSRRHWYGDEAEIADQLMMFTGKTIDEVYPRTLIGITEAENAMVDAFRLGLTKQPDETRATFKARQDDASQLARETMALLTHKKPSGGVELVPVSDPRPAIDGAATYFAGRINMEGL